MDLPHLSRRHVLTLAAGAAAMAGIGPAAAQTQAQPGKGITLSIPNECITMDPHRTATAIDYPIITNIFEGLYGFDVEGNLVPQLAESYEMSPDGKTYTFKMRDNAFFHDGSPVTAEDVAFSWRRSVDPEIRNPGISRLVGNIAGVEVVDPRTARITLKAPDAVFVENMFVSWFIVPQKYIQQVGNAEFEKKPIGTGPFKLGERRPNQFTVLEAFDRHWGRVPKVASVTLRIVPDDQARLAQLQTGEADIIANLPPTLANRVKRIANVQLITRPSYNHQFMYFNARTPTSRFADPRVRRAFNMLVDKDRLAKTVMAGLAMPEALFCSPGTLGCDAPIEPIPVDQAQARKLLDAAGFDVNRPIKIVAPLSARLPQGKEIMESLAHFFGQAGLKSEIVGMDFGAWLALISAKEKDPSVDLIMGVYPDFSKDTLSRIKRQFSSPELWAWVNDPKLDALIDKAVATQEHDARAQAARDVFAHIQKNDLLMPLWSVNTTYLARDNIKWVPTISATWAILWNVERVQA